MDSSSGSANSTSVCPAWLRSPLCRAIRSRISETATNSSPVSAPAALPVMTAKLSQSCATVRP